MKKSIYTICLCLIIVVSLVSCKKKEEQPIPQITSKGPIVDTSGHGTMGQKMEFSLVVPKEVQDSWSAVKIMIQDKERDSGKEFTIAIGNELKIPDSDVTITIGPFLPDFKMTGGTITSASNKPDNPSVAIKVYEGDQQIFPKSGQWGWLYSNFPSVHPFEHQRFALSLKEGVKK